MTCEMSPNADGPKRPSARPVVIALVLFFGLLLAANVAFFSVAFSLDDQSLPAPTAGEARP